MNKTCGQNIGPWEGRLLFKGNYYLRAVFIQGNMVIEMVKVTITHIILSGSWVRDKCPWRGWLGLTFLTRLDVDTSIGLSIPINTTIVIT